MNDDQLHPLPDDHPGINDPIYRQRRAAIAATGASYQPGDPIPDVVYSTDEDDVWRIVSSELAAKHLEFACEEYLRGAERLVLPTTRVPQLREVDRRVAALTGFHIQPVPGLVPTRDFYGALARRTFFSTQYVRHHSVPYYTPEPDIIHEIIGHANMLASESFADLYEAAGRASLRATSDEALEFFSRVFWFTLEFGVVMEHGETRAYGAGLLSSFGEIDTFRSAELRPWNLEEMGRHSYDITHYQPILYRATSISELMSGLRTFFDEFDEDYFSERYEGNCQVPRSG
jgi:phenylalanine-4-hydroxylase